MRKLPLHYRFILESESQDDPILDDPSQSRPPPPKPPWKDPTTPIYRPIPGEYGPPTEHQWDGWDGVGYPPNNWPRFPNGTPYPPRPPEGWPPVLDDDGYYNPASAWPPQPGHPIYEILEEFVEQYPQFFRPNENGTVDWLQIPITAQLKLFREFGIRIWDMRENSNPDDLEWLKRFGFDLLLFMLTRGRAGRAGGGGFGGGFIAPLAFEIGSDVAIDSMEDRIRDRIRQAENESGGNNGNNGNSGNERPENPWGGYWPFGPGGPPPQGWQTLPPGPDGIRTYEYVQQPLPPQNIPGSMEWRVYPGPPAVSRWEWVPSGGFGYSVLYWNPWARGWTKKGEGWLAPTLPTLPAPGWGDIPDNPNGPGYRLRPNPWL